MAEHVQQFAKQGLMYDMGLTEAAIERRRAISGIGPADLERIAAIKDALAQHAGDLTQTFFEDLENLEEATTPPGISEVLAHARELERAHLVTMAKGEYGAAYVERRLELAALYARAGLEVRVYLSAFQRLLDRVGATIGQHLAHTPGAGFATFMAFTKVAFFDLGITMDALAFQRVMRQQQASLRELSTPVLQIRDRMLLLPIIGIIDTHRARMITDDLLRGIRDNRAKVAVMDITGVAVVDSKVANHLLQTVSAARLMGTQVIVTGISPEVAQSLVALGIESSTLTAVGDLQGGLEEADRLLRYRDSIASPPQSVR